MRLKDYVQLNANTLTDETRADYQFQYIDISSVSMEEGIKLSEPILFSDAPSRARRIVHKGDVLVSTVRPYLKSIGYVSWFAHDTIASTGFAVLSANKKLNSAFLAYYALADIFVDSVCAMSKGASYPATNASDIVALEVNFPSLPDQNRIVAYLDEKTAAIDKQVTLLEQKKEKYALLKKSVIKQAVCGEGKDWSYKRFKDITKDLFLGQTPVYTEEDNDFIIFGQRNNQSYGIDWAGIKFADPNFYTSRREYEFLQKGDVLLNSLGGGSVGRSGYFDHDQKGILTDGHIIVIRTNKEAIGKFIYYYLVTQQRNLEIAAIGSTNQCFLTIPDIEFMGLNLPPLSEQKAIADYLDEKCAKIDATIANIDQQIEKYKLLRRALINEVVTGQRAV